MNGMEKLPAELARFGLATLDVNETPVKVFVQRYKEIPYYMIGAENQTYSHVVFFQHGYTKDKDFALPTCLALAAQGYLAIAMDARLHGARRPINFSDYFVPDRFLQSMGQIIEGTVQDISTLLTYLLSEHQVESSQAGIGGFSMGGYVSFIMPLVDARFTVAAPISGSPRWVEKEIPEAYAKMADQVKQKIAQEPLRHAAQLHHVAWLIQHGQNDPVVPIEGSQQFYKELTPYYLNSNRLQGVFYPNTEHVYTVAMQKALVEWFRTHLSVL